MVHKNLLTFAPVPTFKLMWMVVLNGLLCEIFMSLKWKMINIFKQYQSTFFDSFNSDSPIFWIVMGYMNIVAVGISLINVYFLINSLVNYQVKIFKVGFNSWKCKLSQFDAGSISNFVPAVNPKVMQSIHTSLNILILWPVSG